MISRNAGTGDNSLNGVTAVSAADVWAVGGYESGTTTKTLTQHWNGKSWKVVRSPDKGTEASLNSVYAVSSANVWAAGSYSNGSTSRTLVEHWNGRSWKIVWTPNVGAGSNRLMSVRGTSGHDIWAVGDASISSTISRTVILHWTGRRWQLSPSPSLAGATNRLQAVRPRSPGEAWAVGDSQSGSGGAKTLVLHWSKGRWRLVASPTVAGPGSNTLNGVLATSATSAWAVGDYYNGTEDRTLFLRWDGRHWRRSYSPITGPHDSDDVNALGATSAANIYAVGVRYRNMIGTVLIVHWNGSHWQVLQGRNPGNSYNAFTAVFALSARSVWAVGISDSNGGHSRTLIEHCR